MNVLQMLAERKLLEIQDQARRTWSDEFSSSGADNPQMASPFSSSAQSGLVDLLGGEENQKIIAAAYLFGFWDGQVSVKRELQDE